MRELATKTLQIARSQNMRIATAESCTGGMISAALTAIAGSSDVFDRGFVTYSNGAKQDMLGVTNDSLQQHGAVSPQVAAEMAAGALANSLADVAVSVTGIAGPGGSEHKPEGMVCFGLAKKNKETITETIQFGPIGRNEVRKKTTTHALNMITNSINN
jgi:nicotinamide-nucleotide amidase